MLKIRDNIDLKELEKFGFKEEDIDFYNAFSYDHDYKEFYVKKLFLSKCIIAVNIKTREVYGLFNNNCCGYSYRFYNIENIRIVRKLIKAGLVEKVEK